MLDSRDLKQTRAGARSVIFAVAALTVLGFALRLARYQQTVFGDELSTLYIVDGRSLADVMDYVSGDAEITPPLYFILAWLTTKLGSAPELVRLPSLIAGTISIPLVYLVGVRALSRPAALIAAAVMALSPFMISYSADGRGYAVAIALLLGSTLAMLAGARDGRARWWVAYGALSLLAMYTHYTAAFVLVAQLVWLLWAHPRARVPALIANACAAVLYLPWAPGLLADAGSPTTDIIYAIQGSGIGTKLDAIGQWAFGYPYASYPGYPGLVPIWIGAVGFATAAAVGLLRHLRARKTAPADSSRPPLVSPGMALALALALSNVVLALLFLLITGNDLLGARNLATATAGAALLIGAVIVSAGRRWGAVSAVLVIACFAVGALKTLSTENELTDFKSAASYIEAEAGPDDVIVDLMATTLWTPVSLTSLAAYLDGARPEFAVLLPQGEPPFLPDTPVPATAVLLRRAIRQSQGHSLILLTGGESLVRHGDDVTAIRFPSLGPTASLDEEIDLPPGSRVAAEVQFDGLTPFAVVTIDVGVH